MAVTATKYLVILELELLFSRFAFSGYYEFHMHLVRVQYSGCCEELINTYPEVLSSNLFTWHQQFNSYIRHKFSATQSGTTRFSHAELHKTMAKDNIECAFPNVENS